jgi:hypothetical protein
MAVEYVLLRADGHPVGTIPAVEALVLRAFPAAQFQWTTSGPAVRMRDQERADEADRDATRAGLRPSYLAPEARLAFRNGVVEGAGYRLAVWLEPSESAATVYLAWRGAAAELDRGLAALQAATGAALQACAAG